MTEHLSQKKKFKFNSEEEFLQWKENEEEKTFSYFSIVTTFQLGQEELKRIYYCQHDGSDRFHRAMGEDSRRTSRKIKIGQIKKNLTCLAQITEFFSKNKQQREVEYQPTHNHPLSAHDIVYQPVSNSASSFIDKQVSLNVPAIDIYHSVQKKICSRETRKEEGVLNKKVVISKKLIQKRISKRKHNMRLHPDDIISVSLKVELLQKEAYNPVIIFKPTGPESIPGCNVSLGKHIFMLGIQTEEQKKLMLTGQNKILIVDDTHCISQYENMKLLNILICDDSNKGWPVAHLITNLMTSDIIALFIEEMKKKVESEGDNLHVNCLITDDDPALINGFERGLNTKVPHILCQWHLDKTMKINIRTKCEKDLFSDIYVDVKAIIYCQNIEEFQVLIKGFQRKYEMSNTFIEYFNSHYLFRKEKWGMCYRNFLGHGNINTTAHVESFHNRLKKVYFKRIQNKRIDDLINILLQIEQDDYASRTRMALLGFGVDSAILSQRHSDGMAIPDEAIEKITDNLWTIKGGTLYCISKVLDFCSRDLCFEKCLQLSCHSLCSHIYVCSCPDTNYPLCKHIHKLHSFIQRGIVVNPGYYPEANHASEPVQDNSLPNHNKDNVSGTSSKKSRNELIDVLEKYLNLVNKGGIPDGMIPNALTEVKDSYTKFSSFSEMNSSTLLSIPDKEKVDSRKKITTQEQQSLNPLIKKNKKTRDPEERKMKSNEARENLLQYFLEDDDL